MKLSWKFAVVPLVGVVLTCALILQARSTADVASASTAPPSAERAPRVRAEGRLVTYPGAEVTLGTEVRGTIAKLAVEERQKVRRGDLIAELRSDDLRASLAEAQSHVAEAEADVRLYTLEIERADRLVEQKVEAVQNADRARRNREAADARLATARATVSRLQAEIAKTRLTAPIDGVVTAKLVEAGETVDAGAKLVTIADLSRVRVEAEIDEFDAGRVTLGAPAVVRAEGYAGDGWHAVVEEVPDTVVSRRLKPQDPGRPSDTRVLLVKVALREATPLKLGQRVEVELGGQ